MRSEVITATLGFVDFLVLACLYLWIQQEALKREPLGSDGASEDVLLVEYQKAQDSAEHHDTSVGNVTSLWLGSAVLIGFVLSVLSGKHPSHYKTPLFMVALLGITLTILVTTWAIRAGELKKNKYERCKAIERKLGMRQHSQLPKKRQWWQDYAYNVLMSLFFATWLTLLVHIAALKR